MIFLIKKYWKYLAVFFSFVLVCVATFFNAKTDKVEVVKKEKNSSKSEITEKKEENGDDENNLKTVFVDVKGAVTTPGVYELEEGKRIVDAISLAGGLTNKADTINLNLSKKLKDEMYIIVYTKSEIYDYKKNNGSNDISCASVECICPDNNNDACIKNNSGNNQNKTQNENKSTGNKISINTASKEDLMTLSGIGEAKADLIINYRNENGGFKSIEDIKSVKGIGDALYEKIKDNITL